MFVCKLQFNRILYLLVIRYNGVECFVVLYTARLKEEKNVSQCPGGQALSTWPVYSENYLEKGELPSNIANLLHYYAKLLGTLDFFFMGRTCSLAPKLYSESDTTMFSVLNSNRPWQVEILHWCILNRRLNTASHWVFSRSDWTVLQEMPSYKASYTSIHWKWPN